MDERNRFPLIPILFVSVLIVGSIGLTLLLLMPAITTRDGGNDSILANEADVSERSIATFTAQPPVESDPSQGIAMSIQGELVSFEQLYESVGPGVVNIRVLAERNGTVGQGSGSGFILDDQGHIVTNNHVVAGASLVSVIFFNGVEVRAQVVGTDADSDLAVLKVNQLIPEVHPLPLGDSEKVNVGEWVLAIGNPFGNQNSLSIGIVSALGRTIPTGTSAFSIPQSIQTDAAINPGNSGGPLINLNGEVIGVNAQIATGGERANSGVGFAIPVNILRMVAPALIEGGAYEWPWLGVEGTDVNLAIVQVNDLKTQLGAYINGVVDGGPAASAGLQGTSATREVGEIAGPVGGDVIVEADNVPIQSFADLLVSVAYKHPGETIDLVVLRDGELIDVAVELQARP